MPQESFDRPPADPESGVPPRAARERASPAADTAPTADTAPAAGRAAAAPDAPSGPRGPSDANPWTGARRLAAVLPQVAVAGVALVAAAWLAGVSALIALFGGIAAIAIAIAVLAVLLATRRRRTSGWLVLPLLAVAVPAVAVAASGERIAAQRGVEVRVPLTPDEIPREGYRTGLGEQLVDVRHLTIPAGTTVDLRARSDLDRTIVALPRHACWNLDVRWRTGRLWLPGTEEKRWIDGLDAHGRYVDAWARRRRGASWRGTFQGRIALFGRVRRASSGRWVSRVAAPGAPTLRVELRSAGSSFVVRDFPDDVGPLQSPTWPMTLLPPASPAQRRSAWSTPRRSPGAARAWRGYAAQRTAFADRSRALLDGGCGRKVVTP
jgi:hypothetical protein